MLMMLLQTHNIVTHCRKFKNEHIYLFCKVVFAKLPFAHRLADDAELLLLWLEFNNLVMQCFRQVFSVEVCLLSRHIDRFELFATKKNIFA